MNGNRNSFNSPSDNKGKGNESIDSTERTTSRANENRRDDSSTSSNSSSRKNYSAEIAETLQKGK